MPAFSFRTSHASGSARIGWFTTPHGVVETPAFMPVGT
ncbi:MAG: tRNA guanosine(34) transglycosylase Tgt, partial [Gemmatimonadaceae bacterium]